MRVSHEKGRLVVYTDDGERLGNFAVEGEAPAAQIVLEDLLERIRQEALDSDEANYCPNCFCLVCTGGGI